MVWPRIGLAWPSGVVWKGLSLAFAFRLDGLFAGACAHGALGDAGRFAAPVAQVIELGPANRAAALHLDRLDHRRHHGEDPLDAFAEADLADREALLQAAAGSA